MLFLLLGLRTMGKKIRFFFSFYKFKFDKITKSYILKNTIIKLAPWLILVVNATQFCSICPVIKVTVPGLKSDRLKTPGES